MNINNTKKRPKSFVDFIGVAIVTKEMNAGMHIQAIRQIKQVNPGLGSAATEHHADGKQEGCVSLAIKWVRIIFHSLNNLNEVVSRVEEVETKTTEDNVRRNKIVEGVPAVTSHICL